GHEWAKRQASHAGIGFTELSNGFAATADPPALQQICDRLGPGVINVLVQRWLVLPPPSPTPTATPATGGRPPCGRSSSPAPSSSTHPATPAGSSKRSSPTTSTSVGPTTWRSSLTAVS